MKLGIQQLKRLCAATEARMANRPAPGRAHDPAVIRAAVAEQAAVLLGVDPGQLLDGDSLVRRWGMGELDRIQLALALEDRLGLARPLEHYGWRSLGDVVREVERTPIG